MKLGTKIVPLIYSKLQNLMSRGFQGYLEKLFDNETPLQKRHTPQDCGVCRR
jgi:hypothetical protein